MTQSCGAYTSPEKKTDATPASQGDASYPNRLLSEFSNIPWLMSGHRENQRALYPHLHTDLSSGKQQAVA